MPKFVMLSTLGPDGHARLRTSPERLREVNADVEAMGVKVLEQYALLGQWDFLNILEAPDEVTMAKVATTLASRGTLRTLTLTAIEIEDFISVLGSGVGDRD
ncbi:MAG: GYD domain-containing protein [Acidimicrobiales bacterium]